MFYVFCSDKIEYYQGYIYNSKNLPQANVKVIIESTNKNTFTDKNGFFKIRNNNRQLNNLIVVKNENIVDTIKTVWSQHGEKIHYSFIESQNDTLFIK